MRVFAFATMLALVAPPATSGHVAGEDAVFGRFLAPCCWQQTLDIHASPEAAALRDELRASLRAGTTREGIQASLVERYGPRIVAAPVPARIEMLGPLSLAAALALVVGATVRWFGRTRNAAAFRRNASPAADDATLDARIDDELADLDD